MEITAIQIHERGNVPRRMLAKHNEASRAGYFAAAEYWHTELRPKRFTKAHAAEAGYRKHSGAKHPYGSKKFWSSYLGRKIRTGRSDPYVWSGYTKNRANVVNITPLNKEVRLRYGLRVFNFLPAANDDFRRMLPRELVQLGQIFNAKYDSVFGNDNTESTRTI